MTDRSIPKKRFFEEDALNYSMLLVFCHHTNPPNKYYALHLYLSTSPIVDPDWKDKDIGSIKQSQLARPIMLGLSNTIASASSWNDLIKMMA